MTPRDIDLLTPWEFAAAVDGWKAANGVEEHPPFPTPAEHDALMAKYA